MAEPNTRLSGVKQELSVFKSEFSSFEKLKESATDNFFDINAQVDEIEKKKKKKNQLPRELVKS